jgi:hypothetical protein
VYLFQATAPTFAGFETKIEAWVADMVVEDDIGMEKELAGRTER